MIASGIAQAAPEKLKLLDDEPIHIFTKDDQHFEAVVLVADDDLDVVMCAAGTDEGIGMIALRWDEKGKVYRSQPTGHEVRVERPTYVTARLKTYTSADGIILVDEEDGVVIGKKYLLDIVGVRDMVWAHADHPGRTWLRKTGAFTDRDGYTGLLPLELFEIERN